MSATLDRPGYVINECDATLHHHFLKLDHSLIVVFQSSTFSTLKHCPSSPSRSRITLDCATDPCGWHKDNAEHTSTSSVGKVVIFRKMGSLEALYTAINDNFADTNRSSSTSCIRSVIFDSITPLLVRHSTENVARFLSCVDNCTERLVVHFDASLSSRTHNILAYGAQTVISGSQSAQTAAPPRLSNENKSAIPTPEMAPVRFTCSFLVKKASGKVIRQQKSYEITFDLRLKSIENSLVAFAPVDQVNAKASATGTKLDPTAGLTFNLKLSDAQRDAKSALQLPYVHQGVSTGEGNAKIEDEYTAGDEEDDFSSSDSADDSDDDDPDDDLDF